MINYDWAANQTKLAAAETAVKNAAKVDTSKEVTEEAIKAEYIKRGGLVLGEEEIVVKERGRKKGE